MNQFVPFQPGRTLNQPVVNVGRNGLRFNAKTFDVLHHAAYIRVLLDANAGKFAIQAYEKAGVDSIPFHSPKASPQNASRSAHGHSPGSFAGSLAGRREKRGTSSGATLPGMTQSYMISTRPSNLPAGAAGPQGGAPKILKTAMAGRSAGTNPTFLSAMAQKYGAQRRKSMAKSPSTYRKRCVILRKQCSKTYAGSDFQVSEGGHHHA